MKLSRLLTRRGAILSAAAIAATPRLQAADNAKKAQIAITLDLEMSRHYPTREQMHWDFHKGDLNEPAKRYAVEAARRVKAAGGLIHFFLVGQVLEQENVDWITQLHTDGHPIGNHTYDHINVLATKTADLQFRFQRAPWLLEGRTAAEAIAWNIDLCAKAMKQRLGFEPNGFRTPGGFQNGLHGRPDIQRILLDQGYRWISCLYPSHPTTEPGVAPDRAVFEGIVATHSKAQPHRYPTGLLEIPMNGISDVGAFRTARWKLEAFLEATRRSVAWAIESGRMFDFLAHPSCLGIEDPEFKTIDLICELVAKSNGKAEIVGLDIIADGPLGSIASLANE